MLLIRSASLLIPVLLILLTAFFRLADLPLVRHGYDESYQAYLALRLVDGREWLWIGQPSSVFLDNPPLMAYLQAIPLLFWRSPWAVYLFVTLLNTVAVWPLYSVTRKLMGSAAAFLAALLFAINPWVVYYSRLPWTQGLLPFFMVIIAWGLWPTLVTDKAEPRRLFLGLLAAVAMMQTYILAFVIIVPIGVLLLYFHRHLPRWPVWAGVAVLLFSLAFFAWGLSGRSGQNSEKLSRFVGSGGAGLNVEAWEHAVRLITGWEFNGQDEFSPEPVPSPWLMIVAHISLSAALVVGMGQAIAALGTDGSQRRLAIILLVWFGVPIVGLTVLPTLVHAHYLLLSLPAGHLLAAWGLRGGWLRPQLRWLIILGLILGAGQFKVNLGRAGQAAAANPSGDGYNGWVLVEADRLGQTIRALTSGQSYPRRIVAETNAPLLSGLAAAYLQTIDNLAYPHFVVLPGQEPLLYLHYKQPPIPGTLGPHETRFPEQTITLADGTQVDFILVTPYSQEEALALPSNPVGWTSDAGLTLLGYDVQLVETNLMITTYWRVEQLHPDRAAWYITPYYQLFDDQGQLLVNMSQHGQWGYQWQVGDVYVERVAMEVAPPGLWDEATLAIGLYDPIQGHNFFLNGPVGRELFYLLLLPLP